MLSKLRSPLVCTIALLCSSALLPAQTFTNPFRIPTPVDPDTVVGGDLNGDGRPDILWTDRSATPHVLHTLLAQPNGGYVALPTFQLPLGNTDLCLLADFNLDHRLDLVCTAAEQFNSSVSVFLGNGDGTFQRPITTALNNFNGGSWAFPVIQFIGDVNGDGIPDLFEEDAQNNTAQVLLGDGKGSFSPGFRLQPGPNLALPAPAADVNADGIPDLLFPVGPTVALGKGDGTFGLQTSYAAHSYDGATCIFHDMDGDGHLDAVCGYAESANGDTTGNTDLIILHGNTDGSFNTTPISQKTFGNKDTYSDGFGTFEIPLAVADLNGDGILDVLGFSGDGLAVLLGGSHLTFSTPLHYAQAGTGFIGFINLYQSQIIDMNGDGIPDIVAAGPNGVYISYGKRDGSFASAFAPEVTQVIGYPTLADFNGDGIPDVAATGDTAIKLSLGKGDGTFALPTALSNNNGAIKFTTFLPAAAAHILHGDFNGDGKLDLLAIGSSSIYQSDSYILFGHGDGTFDSPRLVPNSFSGLPTFAQFDDNAVFDINHDGRSDLLSSNAIVIANARSAQIYFALSNGDGTFKTVSTTVPADPQNPNEADLTFPALADFNHDGKLDAAYGSFTNAYVVNGHGDGKFDTTSTALPIPAISGVASQQALSVATGDFDGDGNQDFVVLANYATTSPFFPIPVASAAWVFYGNGNSTFSVPILAATFDHNYTNIAAADLNNDGLADIVVKTSGSLGGGYAVGVLTSQPNRSFGPEINYTAGTGLSSLAILDVNRDGRPDLIFGNGDYNIRASSITVLLNESNALSTAATTTTLTCTPSTIPIGTTSLLSAAVTSTSGTPTGSISFTDNTLSLGQPTLTNGNASLPYTGQTAGTHTILSTYVPTGSFAASSASCIVTVTAPVSTPAITLTSSLNPAPALTAITFTAQVPAGSVGTIVFVINGQSISTTPGTAGTSTYTISTLTPGSYPVTASWFALSSALAAQASLTQIITAAAAAPDFSLTGYPTTFRTGQTGTGGLVLASLANFTGTVSTSCVPPYPINYVCTVQLPTVALTPNLSESFHYILQSSLTANSTAPPTQSAARILLTSLFPLTLLSLLGLTGKRRSTLRTLLSLTLLAILTSAITACGPDHYIRATRPGTYPITITATGTNQGSSIPTTHTLTINAIITR